MCEFKVMLNGDIVAEDIVYVKDEGSAIIIRSVVGDEKRIDGCRIIEVDSIHERLVLKRA